jgi:hypothetical protein
VDGAGAGEGFAAVPLAFGDEVLFASVNGNTPPIDDEGVAALDDEHVFVEVVNVRRGDGRFAAGPEGHLRAVGSVEDVALDARRGLAGCGDAVGGGFHEGREVGHWAAPGTIRRAHRLRWTDEDMPV